VSAPRLERTTMLIASNGPSDDLFRDRPDISWRLTGR
jgi:hypothetical protein